MGFAMMGLKLIRESVFFLYARIFQLRAAANTTSITCHALKFMGDIRYERRVEWPIGVFIIIAMLLRFSLYANAFSFVCFLNFVRIRCADFVLYELARERIVHARMCTIVQTHALIRCAIIRNFCPYPEHPVYKVRLACYNRATTNIRVYCIVGICNDVDMNMMFRDATTQ